MAIVRGGSKLVILNKKYPLGRNLFNAGRPLGGRAPGGSLMRLLATHLHTHSPALHSGVPLCWSPPPAIPGREGVGVCGGHRSGGEGTPPVEVPCQRVWSLGPWVPSDSPGKSSFLPCPFSPAQKRGVLLPSMKKLRSFPPGGGIPPLGSFEPTSRQPPPHAGHRPPSPAAPHPQPSGCRGTGSS